MPAQKNSISYVTYVGSRFLNLTLNIIYKQLTYSSVYVIPDRNVFVHWTQSGHVRIPGEGETHLLASQWPNQHVRSYPLQHGPRHGRHPRGRHEIPVAVATKYSSFSQR